MNRKTYKIYTLGCKVNQYDSVQLEKMLKKSNFIATNNNANLAVINSCAVTKTAIYKCKRMLNKARKENPKAKLVLMGCWPKAYPTDAKRMDVDLVWGVGEYDKLIEEISNFKITRYKELSSEVPKPAKQVRDPDSHVGTSQLSSLNRSRYFLKIQDGCEQFCSYCIIPYTRGKLWSKPENDIIAEVKLAIKLGYKEIVLSGIHLGLYNQEGSKGLKRAEKGLVVLLKKIIAIPHLGRIRLSSIEINEVKDSLVNLIASTNKLCKHLHIPLQSGSDKILKLMNRPYTVKFYENRINSIRKKIPDIAISTDVIVGFPGESEKEFFETYELIKKLKFSQLHVFPYSEHERTNSSKLSGKVKAEIKKNRADQLRNLNYELIELYKKKLYQPRLDVVVENKTGENYKGKTEFYFDINFKNEQINQKNKLIKVGDIIKIKYNLN